jgi:hypothetical protein
LPEGQEQEVIVVRSPRNGKLYYSPKGWAHPPTAVVSRNRDWKFVPWKAKANFSDWEPGDWDIVPESQVFGGMR